MVSKESPHIARFGPFQLDLKGGELRKNGRKIHLQEQPFQVLSLLVQHPGELVTREAVRKKLWPNDTVVEFENSIHAAVKKLRLALGDSAEKPRYIETVARRGYRLIVPVERVEVQLSKSEVGSQSRTSPGSGLIGKRVSHYRVLEVLGGGGMGLVYKAEDIKLGRPVALKFLPEGSGDDSVALGRFEREARAASALDHSNICSIYEFGEHEGQPFIAMQFLEGQTVGERIRAATTQGVALTTDELLDIAIQITNGLEAAHQRGIIHRDIKPANIFITNRGEVKILDFGLAKLVESIEVEQVSQVSASGTAAMALNLTRTGAEMGTAAYMSPEQIRREKLDARTDLFSLGLVLYEMATGHQAFAGETALAVHDGMLNGQPISVHELNPGLPPGLEAIISKALEKDREVRYQSAAEMGADLKRLKRSLESRPSVMSATTAERHAKLMVRRRWLWLGLGAPVAIAAVTAAGVWLVHSMARTSEAPLVEVPLTTEQGEAGHPSFSPDGNQVVYFHVAETRNYSSLYVRIIGVSGAPRRLTTQPGYDFSPAWSPDGRYIAFLRTKVYGGANHIFGSEKATLLRVPLTGNPEQTLAEVSGPENIFAYPGPYLAWFPDGRWLVTVDRASPEEPYGLFLLSVDTHEKRKLTMPPPGGGYDDGPAISEDGRWLAFSRGSNASHLYLLELSDDHKPKGEPRQITFENGHAISPAWMPDGRSIVFNSGPYESEALSRVVVSEGSARPPQLLPFGNAFYPAISRHGQRLVFDRATGGGYEIWRMQTPAGGRGAVRTDKLVASTYSSEDPAYSPDGKRIAFKSNRSGRFDIWVCDSDGSNATQLTSSIGSDSASPHWSPDGQHILFDADLEDRADLFLISAQGGTPQRLAADSSWGKFSRGDGSFSRDGKWIYFDLDRGGPSQIWKMTTDPSARDRKAIQVTRNGGRNGIESPDGKYLYYLQKSEKADTDRLMKAPVEGGEETEVLPSVFRQNFAVADEGIYFVPGSSGNRYSIQFLSFSSRKITRMVDIGEPAWGFPLSPVGTGGMRSLLYTLLRRGDWNLFLVENFR